MLLVVVAGLLARRPHWPLARVVDRLGDVNTLRANFPEVWGDLMASIDHSRRLLPDACRHAFASVCGFAGDMLSPVDVVAVSGCDLLVAESLLETLVECRLADVAELVACGCFGYRLAPFVRSAATEWKLKVS